MSLMAFAGHCFHFCLNANGVEKLGCGMSAYVGPGAREITSSNGVMEVEVYG